MRLKKQLKKWQQQDTVEGQEGDAGVISWVLEGQGTVIFETT